MTANNQALGAVEITLPATAPLVRITAGAGTAGQKTWNLRRPVTMFGSRRPAHIVLHDKSICKAHCVIIHTGSTVLLKDLHTTAGTTRNDERIDLVRLRDGDVIGIGAVRIQVAIHNAPGASGGDSATSCDADGSILPWPVQVFLEHTDTEWTIHQAVAMIGRHPAATIRLPHDAISARHAILFPFQSQPAVFDLGSRSGVVVNGSRCTIASLKDREHLGIGPCTLKVQISGSRTGNDSPAQTAAPGTQVAETSTLPSSSMEPGPAKSDVLENSRGAEAPLLDGNNTVKTQATVEQDRKLVETEQHLDDLEENIAESWERLNNWRERMQSKTEQIEDARPDLGTLRAELDHKEAALRGLLHDLTRYHEQISAREKELTKMLEAIGAEQEKITKARLECVERTNVLTESERRLKRSENSLAQRWARLNSMTCSNCGKSIRTGIGDPVERVI